MRIVKEAKQDGTTQYLARPIINGKKLAVRALTKRELYETVADLKRKDKRRRLGLPDPDERLPDITYAELIEKVLDGYQASPQAKTTLPYNLKRSKEAFGRVLVRELNAEQIGSWLARLDLKPTTKRASLKAMRQALTWAVENGYRRDNPAKAKGLMPKEPIYDAHPFESWGDVRLVASSFKSDRDRALVLFASATGLRPQEWLALRWSDLDRENRVVHVRRTVQNGKITDASAKTRGSLRSVRLRALALDALAMLPTPLHRDQLVFPGERGEVINLAKWRRGRWTKALTTAGIPYREPYGMRDTFATLSLADGAPLEWITEQMGHSEIDTTRKHYARWLPSADTRILDALDAHRSQTGLKPDSMAGEAR